MKIHFKKLNSPFIYWKIPDLGSTNPYDCYVRANGQHYSLELKHSTEDTKKQTINFKKLFGYGKQYHQIETLKKEELCGGISFVILNHQLNRVNKIYVMTPEVADKFYKTGVVTIESIRYNSFMLGTTKRLIPGSTRMETIIDVNNIFNNNL